MVHHREYTFALTMLHLLILASETGPVESIPAESAPQDTSSVTSSVSVASVYTGDMTYSSVDELLGDCPQLARDLNQLCVQDATCEGRCGHTAGDGGTGSDVTHIGLRAQCQCDAQCMTYQDCCPDFPRQCPEVYSKTGENLLFIPQLDTCVQGFSVVCHCPLFEQAPNISSSSPWWRLVHPDVVVTGKSSGLHYKNASLFLCNEGEDRSPADVHAWGKEYAGGPPTDDDVMLFMKTGNSSEEFLKQVKDIPPDTVEARYSAPHAHIRCVSRSTSNTATACGDITFKSTSFSDDCISIEWHSEEMSNDDVGVVDDNGSQCYKASHDAGPVEFRANIHSNHWKTHHETVDGQNPKSWEVVQCVDTAEGRECEMKSACLNVVDDECVTGKDVIVFWIMDSDVDNSVRDVVQQLMVSTYTSAPYLMRDAGKLAQQTNEVVLYGLFTPNEVMFRSNDLIHFFNHSTSRPHSREISGLLSSYVCVLNDHDVISRDLQELSFLQILDTYHCVKNRNLESCNVIPCNQSEGVHNNGGPRLGLMNKICVFTLVLMCCFNAPW